MANWTFPTTAQGWAEDAGFLWSSDYGGTLKGGGGAGTSGVAAGDVPVVEGDPLTARVRILNEGDVATIVIELKAHDTIEGEVGFAGLEINLDEDEDSGWLDLTGAIIAPGPYTISSLGIQFGTSSDLGCTIWLDNVYLAETPPVEEAALYGGTDSLALISSLPFDGVNPFGMAVRTDGLIAIGNKTAEDTPMVATAGGDHTSWTDKTDDLDDATGVAALDWINP